ncbi:hypothetical protein PF005_g32218 [Phytophthora fragariae]|uniref:Uncharacterized protein n=2 Tax=Phytophthora fragariae TaxID=53985 RepID=A0A6A3DB07_9STRA|nr:hypothetical protein PF009_g32212 [Phytophthora fragariae]KAE8956437.1 hypothetical protein PF011_g31477 [Phytophthora fragariae]KAE9056210.1 hypothetical protein PF010_g31850 [Phytophthora fragariae]KAE9057921.1 hypothetical protein PF007_g31485 [Phytophthora fragariae]KAE9158991.1 hypothetical protein PF005_g32218 [Phytophthora fragariae]
MWTRSPFPPTGRRSGWATTVEDILTWVPVSSTSTVLHSDNCQTDYPGGPNDSGIMSEMPIDYSSCNGNCIFSIYWLGFQNARWQSYINCVPLSGSGATTQASAGSSVGTNFTEIVSDEAQSSSTQ